MIKILRKKSYFWGKAARWIYNIVSITINLSIWVYQNLLIPLSFFFFTVGSRCAIPLFLISHWFSVTCPKGSTEYSFAIQTFSYFCITIHLHLIMVRSLFSARIVFSIFAVFNPKPCIFLSNFITVYQCMCIFLWGNLHLFAIL